MKASKAVDRKSRRTGGRPSTFGVRVSHPNGVKWRVNILPEARRWVLVDDPDDSIDLANGEIDVAADGLHGSGDGHPCFVLLGLTLNPPDDAIGDAIVDPVPSHAPSEGWRWRLVD